MIINKLISKSAFPSSPRSGQTKPAKTLNLTIFDWDDTIFPTSTFSPRNREEMYQILNNNQKMFTELYNVAANLLTVAIKDSTVLIITNAHSSWVSCSCQVFLPETYRLLQNGIETISAR